MHGDKRTVNATLPGGGWRRCARMGYSLRDVLAICREISTTAGHQ